MEEFIEIRSIATGKELTPGSRTLIRRNPPVPPDDISIAVGRFLVWLTRARPTSQGCGTADRTKPSASIRFCLFLIYYFCLSDFVLKFLPLNVAIVLRYLPEAALYLFVSVLLKKQDRIVSFPLFWPLCLVALTMTVSVILNSSSAVAAIEDYRIYFRFSAFAYIGWRTPVTPGRIREFVRGFLGLMVIELIIAGAELVGGSGVQHFFSPVGGLIYGTSFTALNEQYGEAGWIFGTLADYNHFGIFMTASFVLSLAFYFAHYLRWYLWLAFASSLAVVLSFSRHSLLMLVLSLGCLILLRSKRTGLGRIILAFSGALALVAVLVGVAAHFNPGFAERVQTIGTSSVLEAGTSEDMRLLVAVTLVPRFMSAYPFFGQGPIAPSDQPEFGEMNPASAPTLKAAPDVPGIVILYFGDVVWVMILGLYGCFGLAAIGYLLWTIGTAANEIRKRSLDPDNLALVQSCLVMIVIFVVSGFFGEEMVARDCIPVFWILAGLVLSLASNLSPCRVAG